MIAAVRLLFLAVSSQVQECIALLHESQFPGLAKMCEFAIRNMENLLGLTTPEPILLVGHVHLQSSLMSYNDCALNIHQFSDSRTNNPRNGLALCKNAHWLFDNGLWSIDDDYRIVVAQEAFNEASPNQKPLSEYHGRTISLPADRDLWPDMRHLAWHRKHKLQSELDS